ncbi:HEPACAM family member 2 [Tachyglossus aculeatus]|uniref:HEPACAM family member 2 n=1 Tax=Tachyglossus aculeatus TaxID=9261 RepID=UPI0018F50A8F|nr:HEPACAM family member 2 [Tachyglossus aculeatus]
MDTPGMGPMESSGPQGGIFQLAICFLLLGTCSGLTVTVPSHAIRGTEGRALHLPVGYHVHPLVSEIQVIWLFEGPQGSPKYLLGSANGSVMPDLEYQHRFSMAPPNASLLIHPLRLSDEGTYIVKVNVKVSARGSAPGSRTLSASWKIRVTVDRPVSRPTVQTLPSSGAVERVGNLTLTCAVAEGTRVTIRWLRNGQPVPPGLGHALSADNASLVLAPVDRAHVGNYSCQASNPVSGAESEPVMPTIYYGPSSPRVSSDKGLRAGAVFTVGPGEAVLFHCSADSNPPNAYSWVLRTANTTTLIQHGPHLHVAPGAKASDDHRWAAQALDYMCCAYNNVTGRQSETRFTVIVTAAGVEKLQQTGKSLSSLAVISGISLFLVFSVGLLFLWRKFQPHKVIQQTLGRRPEADYRKAQTHSGHEDALDDFGIYEFVAFPDPPGLLRVTSRSLPSSDRACGSEMPTTIYEVIQRLPTPPQPNRWDLA